MPGPLLSASKSLTLRVESGGKSFLSTEQFSRVLPSPGAVATAECVRSRVEAAPEACALGALWPRSSSHVAFGHKSVPLGSETLAIVRRLG